MKFLPILLAGLCAGTALNVSVQTTEVDGHRNQRSTGDSVSKTLDPERAKSNQDAFSECFNRPRRRSLGSRMQVSDSGPIENTGRAFQAMMACQQLERQISND